MKWNEWWYEWGDTALQTHDSKLSPVGLRHVNSRSWRLPTISIFTIEQGGNILFFETARAWDEPANPDFPSRHPGSRPLVLLLHIRTHYLITDIKMMCYVFLLVSISWLAKRFQLLIFMTLMMYYIGLNIFFFSVFICVVTVVKTHLCSCFPHDAGFPPGGDGGGGLSAP